jgi:hypothetical protein
MADGRQTPAAKRKTMKQKKIRVQVGDNLDVTVGFYASPRALVLLSGLAAGCGCGGYLIQR